MTYSVLGLDPSMTCSGWAHYRKGDKAPTWGLIQYPAWGDDEGRYLWDWFERVGRLCSDREVTHIFIEDVRFHHQHSETLTQMIASIGLISMATIVAYKLTQRGQPVELLSVQPQVWRKLFLGALPKPDGMSKHLWRKALKEAAVGQCHKRGWMVEQDDEADACGIMTYGVCTIDPAFQTRQGPLFRAAEKTHDDFVRDNR
mgnify:FL=1